MTARLRPWSTRTLWPVPNRLDLLQGLESTPRRPDHSGLRGMVADGGLSGNRWALFVGALKVRGCGIADTSFRMSSGKCHQSPAIRSLANCHEASLSRGTAQPRQAGSEHGQDDRMVSCKVSSGNSGVSLGTGANGLKTGLHVGRDDRRRSSVLSTEESAIRFPEGIRKALLPEPAGS